MTVDQVAERRRRCRPGGFVVAAQRRLPVAELLTAAPGPVTDLADRVGFDARTIHRWIAQGGIPESYADECAIALGLHPALLWREW